MISARKAKHLDVTSMFTYSHANTPLGQSVHVYYLSYFIIVNGRYRVHQNLCLIVRGIGTFLITETDES